MTKDIKDLKVKGTSKMADICCKKNEYLWCKDEDVVYNDDLGNSYCVFHAPSGSKGISLIEFNEIIFDRIRTTNEKGSVCNLRGTIFEGDINFGIYESPLHIDFKGLNSMGMYHFQKIFSKKSKFC
jgi:hypothetical protein